MAIGSNPIAISELTVCAFAAYGTLFDMAATVGRTRDRLGGQARELARLWRLHQQRLVRDEGGPSSLRDFWHITGRALDTALAEIGIKDALLRARLMQLVLDADSFPDARAAMEGLRSFGLKIAVFSNATLTMLFSALKHSALDVPTDNIVPAAPSAFKPAESAYAFLCAALRLEPARVLYVSADPSDAEGAARAGLKAVWLRRDAASNAAPKSAIATIATLTELSPLLSRG
jgi:2-haloacid dehalogenase